MLKRSFIILGVCILFLASCNKIGVGGSAAPEAVLQPPPATIPTEASPAAVPVAASEQAAPTAEPVQQKNATPATGGGVKELAQDITEKFRMCVVAIYTFDAASGSAGQGTGFIAKKDPQAEGKFKYQILTSSHVLDEGRTEEKAWHVKLADLSEVYESPVLLGFDPVTDVAVLEITTEKDLPVCELGTASGLKTLDDVIAIGNTKGLGIVTTTGQINIPETGVDNYDFALLQTDAATSAGNSGCPIFDMSGRVVALHSFGSRETGSLVGFEIPVDRIKKTYQAMLADPYKDFVKHGDWGLSLQVLDSEMRNVLSQEKLAGGVAVSKIYKDSPAGRAGLKEGDIIASINGDSNVTRLERPFDIYRVNTLISDSKEGETVALEIIRDGKKTPVNLVARDISFGRRNAFHTPFAFTVADVSDADVRYYNISEKGVWVYPDDPKADMIHQNLLQKSLITHINGKPAPNVAEFKRLFDDSLKSGAKYLVLTSIQTARYYSELGVDSKVYTIIRL